MTATTDLKRPTEQEKEALVLQYAPLVRHVARSLPIELRGVMEFEDAVSFGMCGLIEAIDRYDPDRGTNFNSYAVSRIRGAIIDAFRRMDRLSRTMRQKVQGLQKARAELEAELGRSPTEAELVRSTGMELSKLRETETCASVVTVSLERISAPDQDRDGARFEIVADDDESNFASGLEERELRQALAGAIKSLPERERLVMALYYKEELTMREIASVLSVSETRVSQLHAQAVRRLRLSLQGIAA
jgi:RNA polymerase sigma factor for flagellar operon FliA